MVKLEASYFLKKKIFFSILSFFLTSLSFFSVVSAQVSSSSNINVLATVNIYNATFTQNGNIFTIYFDLTNRVGIQPGVKYSAILAEKTEDGQGLVDEFVFPDTVNLGENSLVHKVVTYEAPVVLEGTYDLIISSKNTSGFPFGLVSLGSVNLTKDIYPTGIVVDTASCYLTIIEEKSSKQYKPLQGVDIAVTETLQSNCIITNTSSSSISVTPSFVTKIRSKFGDVVDTESAVTEPITLLPHEKKLIVTSLPKSPVPQVYAVDLAYGNSNKVSYNYVIQGTSGTIQSFIFDKDTYAKGDVANLSLLWTGSVDNFSDSRKGTSTELSTFLASISIIDELGKTCAEPYNEKLTTGNILVQIKIPMTESCSRPVADVTLFDSKSELLSKVIFSTATTTLVTTATTTPTATTTLSATSTTQKSNKSNTAGILIVGIIFSAILFYLLYKRKSVLKIIPVFLVIIISSMFVGAGSVKADTFVTTLYDGTGRQFITTVSLDKNSYAPGEAVTISASTQRAPGTPGSSANLVYLLDTPLVFGTFTSGAISIFNGFLPVTGSLSGVQVFNAPSSLGNHAVNFYIGVWGTLSDSSQWYSISNLTVAAASTGTWTAPTCPTACGTAASTLPYSCVGGNGLCSINSPATLTCPATTACASVNVWFVQ